MVSTFASLNSLLNKKSTFHSLPVADLVEHCLQNGEATLTSTGAVRALTGEYTGRSPEDKFIVVDKLSENTVEWGKVNQPITVDKYERLYNDVLTYLDAKPYLYHFMGAAGAHVNYQSPISVVTEKAWHSLFSHQLFINEVATDAALEPITVINACGFKADPSIHGTNSETFIILSLSERVVLIGGTEYAGEIKKSIFSALNFFYPSMNVFPMHCSANVGAEGDVSLFFGLSGTGKTTLSADPTRKLIGDDEHGWSASGVFNMEGGCYAKCIGLTEEKEPQIYQAIRFGSVLENVALDEQKVPDFSSNFFTENTRAAYSLDVIPNRVPKSYAGHPNTIIFLTADAFGVLPPISRLTKEQAMFHFLSGYTSKLAGTERGVTQPRATFSTCFGSPFLPLPATEYAKMLGEKLDQHDVKVYLINTGWSGGAYGVGNRISLKYTRMMIRAVMEGELEGVETTIDPIFQVSVPTHVPGVPDHVLQPKKTWENGEEYDIAAHQLAKSFHLNFKKFSHELPDLARIGGPVDEL